MMTFTQEDNLWTSLLPPPPPPPPLSLSVFLFFAALSAGIINIVVVLLQKPPKKATHVTSDDAADALRMTWREDEGQAIYGPISYDKPTSLTNQQQQPTFSHLPIYHAHEIAQHNSITDCWLVIHGLVYDVTSFTNSHPGGWLTMSQFAGVVDGTDAFEAYHPARVHATLLPRYLIGRLAPQDEPKPDEVEVILRQVRQEAIRLGLFESSSIYYGGKALLLAIHFACALVLSMSAHYFGLGAFVMGLFWQQFAFIGHDVGHNCISQRRLRDNWWGVVTGNTLMGISLGWWKQSHNVHHVVCNSVEHDPDIQHMPVFAISPKMMEARYWSTYHRKWFDISSDAAARCLISYQHIIFFPVMTVARMNLYLQSWLALLFQRQGPIPFRKTEIITLFLFFVWVTLLACSLPEPAPQHGLMWITIAHATAGLLHVQICLSHFAMDVYTNVDNTRRKKGWFALQLQTTLNVDTHPALDWLHGGLQFQIEHHFFPRMPRHNLRAARALVRKALPGIVLERDYHELPFFRANILLLQTMKRAAEAARSVRIGNGGFYQSALYDGLSANG